MNVRPVKKCGRGFAEHVVGFHEFSENHVEQGVPTRGTKHKKRGCDMLCEYVTSYHF